MSSRYFSVIIIMLALLFLCAYTFLEGTPAYLSASRGGGSVPVFGDLDAIESGLSRGDPISAMNQNKICDALDGTLVEVKEDTKTHMGWVGNFMKVTILDGDCKDKEGWVEINNIRKRLR